MGNIARNEKTEKVGGRERVRYLGKTDGRSEMERLGEPVT